MSSSTETGRSLAHSALLADSLSSRQIRTSSRQMRLLLGVIHLAPHGDFCLPLRSESLSDPPPSEHPPREEENGREYGEGESEQSSVVNTSPAPTNKEDQADEREDVGHSSARAQCAEVISPIATEGQQTVQGIPLHLVQPCRADNKRADDQDKQACEANDCPVFQGIVHG